METGLEVNADKTKYMVISRDQNAEQFTTHRLIKVLCKGEFKYLGTTLTNQNSIEEEIKSRLKSGNVCYHLAQNPLSSSVLSKNVKINPYPANVEIMVSS